MQKKCSKCERDLSSMKLDFSRKIICSRCLLLADREAQENVRNSTHITAIKKLYEAIKSREIVNVEAVKCLERITGTNFKNTRDFHNKMKNFLEKHDYRGVDLRRARKLTEMDRGELANWLGVSKHKIKQMETNKKALSREALDFIMIMGLKKTLPLRKWKKRAPKGYSIKTPQKLKTSPKKKAEKQQVLDPLSANNEDEQDPYQKSEERATQA